MTRYTRRHYEDCVAVIKKAHAVQSNVASEKLDSDWQAMLTMISIDTWDQFFRMESETYDPAKFVLACLKACEIDPTQVPRTFLPNSVRAVLPDEA
jgi:hypothetical protein